MASGDMKDKGKRSPDRNRETLRALDAKRSGGELPVAPGELMRAVGASGTLVVFADKVVIRPAKGAASSNPRAPRGDVEIQLASVAGVRFRDPSFTLGHLQLEVPGASAVDDNRVTFRADRLDEFVRARELLERLLDPKQADESAASSGSGP